MRPRAAAKNHEIHIINVNKKWKTLLGKAIYTNCYAYALDLIIPDHKQEIFIPGCISDSSTEKVLWTDVTGHVKKDLDFLGIEYREDASPSTDTICITFVIKDKPACIANEGPVCPVSPSMVCLPQITRSGCNFPIARESV